MELVTDTDAAVEFINGVIPAGMAEEAAKLAAVELKPVEESVTVLPKPEPTVSNSSRCQCYDFRRN